jgi:hypothetical protein
LTSSSLLPVVLGVTKYTITAIIIAGRQIGSHALKGPNIVTNGNKIKVPIAPPKCPIPSDIEKAVALTDVGKLSVFKR